MLTINGDEYEVDKEMLVKHSEFFNNYYALVTENQPITIDDCYNSVIEDTLSIIMDKMVMVTNIVGCQKLLDYFCCNAVCFITLDNYVYLNKAYWDKCELFLYNYKWVDHMEYDQALNLLKNHFTTMTPEKYIYLLSITYGIVSVSDFLPYIKYIDWVNKDKYEVCDGDEMYKKMYKKHEDIIDEHWEDKLVGYLGGLKLPDNVAILGGSVCAAVHKYGNMDGDIDVYVWGETKEERVCKVEQCIGYIFEQYPDAEVTNYLNIYKVKIDGLPEIQVINSREICIEDIFNNYDLSICRLGYYKGELIGDMSAIQALVTQMSSVNEVLKLRFFRLQKYTNRGYSLLFRKNAKYEVQGNEKSTFYNGQELAEKLPYMKINKKEVVYVPCECIKEYNIEWLKCYTNDAITYKEKKLIFHAKNVVVNNNNLVLNKELLDTYNKKLKKKKFIIVDDLKLLIPPINNKLIVNSAVKIIYKDNKIHDSDYFDKPLLCDLIVIPILKENDCSATHLKVVYVRIKRFIENEKQKELVLIKKL